MASALGADISIIYQHSFERPSDDDEVEYTVTEVHVRKLANDEQQEYATNLRIVLVGGLGTGKSTLLSHITHGIKDNGRGRARLSLLRHRHEVESGRSSSISHEIIGYDSKGQLVNYGTMNVNSWEDICDMSSKVITFLDTCGYPKYLRTTISGLMGYPDYACLVIAGNAGTVSDITREHLSIAIMLSIPVFVVITKVDIASSSQLRQTLQSLLFILKSSWINKVPMIVTNEDDLVLSASHLSRRGPELPIFMVSNVKGTNMELLQNFFNCLTKSTRMNYDSILEQPAEFQIDEVYSPPDVGTVIGGVLCQGRINIKDEHSYYVGPNPKGKFMKVKVGSIHRHRISVSYVHCSQAATLALQTMDESTWKIHKGMVLISSEDPQCFITFEVELLVLSHATGVTQGTRGIVHSGSTRQLAKVIEVSDIEDITETADGMSPDKDIKTASSTHIYSGQKGRCTMRFMYEPRYLRLGSQILFMEGKSKCVGHIVGLNDAYRTTEE
ncbi:P-loop containing nucleoside triphosphate hydrolase protein [Pilobolus umbonatus]|nr:P-loop containing nucleoside triphosphate hydrolase protein [Pilobolus umbonatus]